MLKNRNLYLAHAITAGTRFRRIGYLKNDEHSKLLLLSARSFSKLAFDFTIIRCYESLSFPIHDCEYVAVELSDLDLFT